MTLEFYKHEEDRITVELQRTMPGTDEYQALLRDLNNLTYVAIQTIDTTERMAFVEENEASNAPVKLTTLTPVEPEPEPEPEPESSVTFDELKSRFVAAARTGIDVGAIIADFGYAKLSDVPKSKYADLLEALPEAT